MKMKKWQMIKDMCINQCKRFQEWDKQKKYATFHSSHYDWWAFPVDKPSSHGDKYQIGSEQRQHLIQDKVFITALQTNALLVCRSWGYDLQNGIQLTNRTADQRWQNWPIRLYKMTNSLEIFKQQKLHKNAIKYGMGLINQKKKFSYGGKNLAEYFQNHMKSSKDQQRQSYNIQKDKQQQNTVQKQQDLTKNDLIFQKDNPRVFFSQNKSSNIRQQSIKHNPPQKYQIIRQTDNVQLPLKTKINKKVQPPLKNSCF